MVEDYPRTLLEFERRFSGDEACREYLAALRWPGGFVCGPCGGRSAWQTGRGRWRCQACRHETSVTAGTVFQDTHLPLMLWFRAMWYITSQKYGVSALGVQRMLGLGSYKTAWALLHKLRHAMVRPGRDRLRGSVEVDEAYWGGEEDDVSGRKTNKKALIAVAAEENGRGIGRIRLRQIFSPDRTSLHTFIRESIEPGSAVKTDGDPAYQNLKDYWHQPEVQRRQPEGVHLLPRVHRVISLFKRWLMGTHQGAVERSYLDYYLDEFTFRFNRRNSKSRGKLFFRLAQQAVQVEPMTFDMLCDHNP
jgi:ISXO2-like transposase domain/Transposase zinc-ribbon domain